MRSKLKLKKHKGYWVAIGSIPERQADGTIAYRRVERGLGPDLKSKAEREDYVARLNKYHEDRALTKPLSFARAYTNYIETGHKVPLFAEAILRGIGTMQCVDINDTVMVDLRRKMFAADAKPSHINRNLYTPVNAILKMASKGQTWKPDLTRPKGHKESPPVEVPKGDWFKRVLPYCHQNTVALVAFLTVHGRRLGEGLGRVTDDYDREARTLSVGRDKNGDPRLIELLPQVAELIEALPVWNKDRVPSAGNPNFRKEREWIFGCGPNSASNIRDDILLACCLASGHDRTTAWQMVKKPSEHREALDNLSVPYFSPHELGRHSFASRLLAAGFSLQYVKDAGGWKTIEMVSNRYGHLEKKETTRAVHEVGKKLADDQF